MTTLTTAAPRSPIPGTPPDWTPTPLGTIAAKVGSGATPRGGSAVYLPTREKWALVRSQNVYDRHFDEGGLAFITDEAADELSGVALEAGDILLNITGDGVTFARACAVPAHILPACVNQHVVRIRCDRSKCEPGFLLSYLTHPLVKPYIESFNAGGSRRAITKGNIESFVIPLPPPPTQRAIAGVLSVLDDKIEVNRRMARTLEEAARALFESWFVRFEHPNADGDASRLVESPTGPIPEGWTVRPLDSIARFLNGLALQKFPPKDGDPTLPVIKIAQLRKGDTVGADQANTEIAADYVVSDGDLLFSWSGSLECVLWTGGPGALNQHLFKVTSTEFPRWFLYLWVQHHLPEFRHIAAAKATTMGHIQRHHLTQALVAVPPAAVLAEMDRTLGPMIDAIPQRLIQARTLAEARDGLLPRLMSGELEIPPALLKEAAR